MSRVSDRGRGLGLLFRGRYGLGNGISARKECSPRGYRGRAPLRARRGRLFPKQSPFRRGPGRFCPPRPGCLFRRCRSVASPLTAHPGPGPPASPSLGAGLRRAARRCLQQSSSSKRSSAAPRRPHPRLEQPVLGPGSIQNLLGEVRAPSFPPTP